MVDTIFIVVFMAILVLLILIIADFGHQIYKLKQKIKVLEEIVNE